MRVAETLLFVRRRSESQPKTRRTEPGAGTPFQTAEASQIEGVGLLFTARPGHITAFFRLKCFLGARTTPRARDLARAAKDLFLLAGSLQKRPILLKCLVLTCSGKVLVYGISLRRKSSTLNVCLFHAGLRLLLSSRKSKTAQE